MNFKATKPYMFKVTCIALTFTLTLTSCDEKDLLNPVPQTELASEFIFDTPARVLGMVNGMYGSVKNGSFLGGRNLMLNDIRGEDFLNRTQNVFTGYDAWLHTVNSGSADAGSTWGAAYTAINSANLMIDGLAVNPDVVSPALFANYIGEAKFIRALCYYYLVTMYGQPYTKDNGASPAVPLRLKAETTTANNDLAVSTVAQVYTQILKDLDEAETAVPLNYSTALLNTSRAHRNTVIALKTRVYLSMGDFPSVILEAKKIVSETAPFQATTGVPHKLENIVSVFSTYTTTESIFSMPMTVLNNVGGQSGLAVQYTSTFEYNLNPSGIYGDPSWRATDLRKANLTAPTLRNVTGPFLTKFSKFNPSLDYVPIVRYAEVLLNYAEAAARTGDSGKAIALLTAVRNRSDAGYVFPAEALAPDALVNTIWIERRIELLGEGHRSRDIMRNLLSFPAKGSGGLQAPAISPSQPEYVFPIPNSERSTNGAL